MVIVTSPHCYPSVASTLLLVSIGVIPFILEGAIVEQIIAHPLIPIDGTVRPMSVRERTLVYIAPCAKPRSIVCLLLPLTPTLNLVPSRGLVSGSTWTLLGAVLLQVALLLAVPTLWAPGTIRDA